MSRLLIAHGSPDPRHREVMQRLAIATEQRSGQSTCVAYLDHDQPNVDEALSTAANGPAAEHVDALGLFLSDGYHARVDVPAALAAFADQGTVSDHGTLGMGPWLIPALERELLAVGVDVHSQATGVVLVAAGSSRPEAREGVVRVASHWQRERGGPVRPAFASGPGPSLDEALAMLTDAGCSERSIALLMLAPGVLADRVVEAAAVHSVPITEPIATASEVIDRIIARTVTQHAGDHGL